MGKLEIKTEGLRERLKEMAKEFGKDTKEVAKDFENTLKDVNEAIEKRGIQIVNPEEAAFVSLQGRYGAKVQRIAETSEREIYVRSIRKNAFKRDSDGTMAHTITISAIVDQEMLAQITAWDDNREIVKSADLEIGSTYKANISYKKEAKTAGEHYFGIEKNTEFTKVDKAVTIDMRKILDELVLPQASIANIYDYNGQRVVLPMASVVSSIRKPKTQDRGEYTIVSVTDMSLTDRANYIATTGGFSIFIDGDLSSLIAGDIIYAAGVVRANEEKQKASMNGDLIMPIMSNLSSGDVIDPSEVAEDLGDDTPEESPKESESKSEEESEDAPPEDDDDIEYTDL